MSHPKRKHQGMVEVSMVKKSRSEVEQILEPNQLTDTVNHTVLSILGEAKSPISRAEIKERVTAKLNGTRIRGLGYLSNGAWHHMVQGMLHNGLAKSWLTVIVDHSESGPESKDWIKKYQGRDSMEP